ncbi:MAG: CHAP domain-containing protein [Burkholderiaceae bacterium]
MDRRDFVRAASTALSSAAFLGGCADHAGAGKNLLEGAAPYAYPFVDYWTPEAFAARLGRLTPLGTGLPSDADIAMAQDIVQRAPTSSPLEVMRYFASLSQVGSSGERFNDRWKQYENPIIVWFFHATHTVPNGDCTSWCAAFLSWCLERCGIPSMQSASSQDYAHYAKETLTPLAGDVVVFSDIIDPAHGHVALLVSQSPDKIEVIGGNQGSGPPIPSCPSGFPVTTISVAWRKLSGDHGQHIRTYRRYT